jgi:hypothetical protein
LTTGANAGAGPQKSTTRDAHVRAACHPRGPGELINDRVYVGANANTRLQSGHYKGRSRITKTPLFVRRDEAAVLSTDKDGPVRLIKWATEKPAHVQTIDEATPGDLASVPTPDHCNSDWRFFAGGFLFRGHHCVVLHVASDEVSEDLEYGLRSRCA